MDKLTYLIIVSLEAREIFQHKRNIHAGTDFIANFLVSGQYIEMLQTSTFAGDVSAPNMCFSQNRIKFMMY